MGFLKYVDYRCPRCGKNNNVVIPESSKSWWFLCSHCEEEILCRVTDNGYELPIRETILDVRKILGPGKFIANWEEAQNWGEEEADVIWYQGDFYIDVWKDEYHLILEAEEYTSSCLSELEYLLAEYKLACVGGKYKDLF